MRLADSLLRLAQKSSQFLNLSLLLQNFVVLLVASLLKVLALLEKLPVASHDACDLTLVRSLHVPDRLLVQGQLFRKIFELNFKHKLFLRFLLSYFLRLRW